MADDWDHMLASRIEGATVLVGLTHVTAEGERREQFFGTAMAVLPGDGVVLRLEGSRAGELYTLPPDLDAFEAAGPGTYRLKATGEDVVDPDYTASWTISAPTN